jgi:hypothetical protein
MPCIDASERPGGVWAWVCARSTRGDLTLPHPMGQDQSFQTRNVTGTVEDLSGMSVALSGFNCPEVPEPVFPHLGRYQQAPGAPRMLKDHRSPGFCCGSCTHSCNMLGYGVSLPKCRDCHRKSVIHLSPHLASIWYPSVIHLASSDLPSTVESFSRLLSILAALRMPCFCGSASLARLLLHPSTGTDL